MSSSRGRCEPIASNIRAELARRGITQIEVAEALGITLSAASRRIRGRIPISAVELKQFAELLGVSADSLLTEYEGAA